jgi:hypothetical protein
VPKSTVVHLARPSVSKETVRACRLLLQEAEAGRLIGLSWAAHLPGHEYEVDIAGEARRLPAFTAGIVLKLLHEILSLPPST